MRLAMLLAEQEGTMTPEFLDSVKATALDMLERKDSGVETEHEGQFLSLIEEIGKRKLDLQAGRKRQVDAGQAVVAREVEAMSKLGYFGNRTFKDGVDITAKTRTNELDNALDVTTWRDPSGEKNAKKKAAIRAKYYEKWAEQDALFNLVNDLGKRYVADHPRATELEIKDYIRKTIQKPLESAYYREAAEKGRK